MLITLKDRGLLVRLIKRRGTVGGSEWALSSDVLGRLFDLKES